MREIWTAGFLQYPHHTTTRTEERRHITGHRDARAEELSWIAVRLDPLDFGRMIYREARPRPGEPSWREVGAIALEHLLVNFRTMIDQIELPAQVRDEIRSSVNLSAAIVGPTFGTKATALGLDARYAYLQFSWIGSPSTPMSVPFTQSTLINTFASLLVKRGEELKRLASERFPLGAAIEREVRYADFSPEEFQIAGIDPNELQALHALSQDPKVADVQSINREAFEGCATPASEPVDATDFALENSILADLDHENPDIKVLREYLARRGFNLAFLPNDFTSPTIPYLAESYDGVTVLLELAGGSSTSTVKSDPHNQVMADFGRSFLGDDAPPTLKDRISLQFSISKSLTGDERSFVQVSLSLPELTKENEPLRTEILRGFQEWLVAHLDYFKNG
jgi:hypothetical protein